MLSDECPRCRALAFYQVEGNDVSLTCKHCGHLAWITLKTKEGMTITRKAVVHTTARSLPARNSCLYRCLVYLANYGSATTGTVAFDLSQSNKLIGNSFTVLSARGLVDKVQSNKGKRGGSLWALSPLAKRLLGV